MRCVKTALESTHDSTVRLKTWRSIHVKPKKWSNFLPLSKLLTQSLRGGVSPALAETEMDWGQECQLFSLLSPFPEQACCVTSFTKMGHFLPAVIRLYSWETVNCFSQLFHFVFHDRFVSNSTENSRRNINVVFFFSLSDFNTLDRGSNI